MIGRHTVLLSEAGFVYNASSCAISTNKIRTLPELQTVTKAKVDIPLLHIPERLPIVAKHELPRILEAAPPETQELDDIRACLATAHHSYDVDTLFQVHQTSLRAERKSYWHLITTTAICMLAILLVLYFSLGHRIPRFRIHCLSTNTSSQTTMANQSFSQTSKLERSNTATQRDTQPENVAFATYAQPQRNYRSRELATVTNATTISSTTPR